MPRTPLHELFAEVATIVEALPYRLVGAWSRRVNRVYASPAQLGSGVGPFVDEVRFDWNASVECVAPVVLLELRDDGRELRWSKQSPSGEAQVRVTCIAADAGPEPPAQLCTLGALHGTTGVPHVVATVAGVLHALLVLPRSAVKTARNHLWHLRPELAASLPPATREILTRGRAGHR